MLDTISDLTRKIKKRARKPWFTKETINKMDARRKWNNVNMKEGEKNHRRLRNEMKQATAKAKMRSYNLREEDIMI